MRSALGRWGLGLALAVDGSAAWAQDPCDHLIPAESLEVNGPTLGIEPGDVVCVQAGARDFLRFYDVVGTPSSPVLIRNSGGRVLIDNPDRGYGLTFSGSRYFRLTGTGSEETYGFSVRATRTGPDYSASCVSVEGLSRDYEIDHLEIFDCGFAGMNLKTEPTCDLSANLGNFVQTNSRVHHNFIHDTHGEGIYFGSTGYGGREYQCDGQATTLYPHTHEGVWIHDNLIFDTGWDGLQVGVSPKDCFIYRNAILRVGLSMEQYQMQGIQIGGASRCVVSENFLAHGPAIGIIALDGLDTRIENNLVFDFQDGIYVNDRDNEESQGARFAAVHNTLVAIGDRAISFFGARSQDNLVANNLISEAGTPLAIGAEVDVVQAGNLLLDSTAQARFASIEEEDFSLLGDSPARDAGAQLGQDAVPADLLGGTRDELPDAGAYEFGAEAGGGAGPLLPGGGAAGPGGSVPGAGEPGLGDGSGGVASSDGCACRQVQRSPAGRGRLWLLLPLALLLRRRQRGFRGLSGAGRARPVPPL